MNGRPVPVFSFSSYSLIPLYSAQIVASGSGTKGEKEREPSGAQQWRREWRGDEQHLNVAGFHKCSQILDSSATLWRPNMPDSGNTAVDKGTTTRFGSCFFFLFKSFLSPTWPQIRNGLGKGFRMGKKKIKILLTCLPFTVQVS